MPGRIKTDAAAGHGRGKRAQTTLEYLLIYSWAILLVAVIAAFLYLFIAAPPLITPSQCSFTSGAYCQDLIFGSNSVASGVAMFLTNTQEYAIAYPQITANFSGLPSVVGTCSPSVVMSGGAMVCNVLLQKKSGSFGSLVSGKLMLSAITCPSSNAISCANGQRQSYAGAFDTHVIPMFSSIPLTVTLSAATPTPIANGNRDLLTANVKLLGMPIAGATVTFSQSNSFALLLPGSATTDSNGNAQAYISSPTPGYTLVYASFGAIGVPANILIDFISPASVAIQVSPGVCSSQNPAAVTMVIDSQNYACSAFPLTMQYMPSTAHSYSMASQVASGSATRYLFSSISGCGISTQSGTFTTGAASSNCLIYATYNAQYYLAETASSPGVATLLPGSYWNSAGNVVTINVVVIGTNAFSSWAGTGSGSYTGTYISNTIVINNPVSEQANFVGSTSSTSTSTSTSASTSTSTIASAGQYIYCVGTQSASPYNYVYYAPISSTGIGTWIGGPNYPVGMYYAGCSISNGNYLYCVGTYATSTTKEIYYAPISSTGFGSWTASPNYPVVMFGAGCSISGGYIYCMGSPQFVSGKAYYAPISSTGIGPWVSSTDLPDIMCGSGCSINNGIIYCEGSTYGFYYAPISSTGIGTWSGVRPYPVSNCYDGCSISNNYMYCVGSDVVSPYTQVYYAPVSITGVGPWVYNSKPYPVGMYDAGCAINSGYIYCVGTSKASSNLAYYAPVSSTGIGAWVGATNYPVGMTDGSCQIPGTGGGFEGGGGPS